MIKGITFGAFDLLHAGHLLMLKEAKEHCDHLTVGLHIDPSLERKQKNKPVESVFERTLRLDSCKYVDEIIPYETEEDLLHILNNFNFDVRFIGEEYQYKDFTGKPFPIKIHYNKRCHNYSSTNLRARVKSA